MKDNKKILFVCHTKMDVLNSAIKVRCFNLYQNLKKFMPVILISGKRRIRRFRLLKFILSCKILNVKYLYVEPSTTSAIEMDIILIALCKLLGIPIGIFIRDTYPLFKEYWVKPGLKGTLLNLGWHLSVWFYLKLADVIFFPTASMSKPFSHKNIGLLPPGGTKVDDPFCMDNELKTDILYVGGANPDYYDIKSLIKCYLSIREKIPNSRCILVLRKSEEKYWKQFNKVGGVSIQCRQMSELPEVMKSVAFGVIPLRNSPYLELCISVKLFEYMSFGLPVIVSNRNELAGFVTKNKIGLVYKNQQDLMEKALSLLTYPAKTKEIGQKALQCINTGNLWEDRARSILKELREVKIKSYQIK